MLLNTEDLKRCIAGQHVDLYSVGSVCFIGGFGGAPGTIRTCDRLVRSQAGKRCINTQNTHIKQKHRASARAGFKRFFLARIGGKRGFYQWFTGFFWPVLWGLK